MSRVKISEYRAKKLLLGDAYQGLSFDTHVKHPGVGQNWPKGRFVVKVDQGVKQRYKKGLLFLDQSAAEVPQAIATLQKKGYTRILVEPYEPRDSKDEQYLSLERVRGGIRIMRSRVGGIDIEAHPESVETSLYDEHTADPFLKHLVSVFDAQYFSFLEINPLVGETPLDAAALVDSAAAFFAKGWSEDDIAVSAAERPAEARITSLQKTSPASFKLTVLNPDAPLWFLLSGGGGSIVVLDEVATRGGGALIGNYGEYSGGPTREETYLYAKEVIGLLIASKAKKKALVIAGGIANFTDVGATFAGIIDALTEVLADLRKQNISIYIRRGGPHEREGLRVMQNFLTTAGITCSIHGSEAIITSAAREAVEFIRA